MSTNHIAQINPTVPHTLIGGKSLIMLKPLFSRIIYDTVLLRAIVGIKTSALKNITQYIIVGSPTVEAQNNKSAPII
jgi:hypothetical protein